jgi:hypothetical protein
MKDLNGKVAAVTGAGSGIGRGLALRLADQGCHLALCDVNEAGLAETAELLKGRPVKVTTAKVDVTGRDAVEAWAGQAVADHGGVDVVINNAGVAVFDRLETVRWEDFEWVIDVDFWGVVYGTRAFLPYLRKRPEGCIVNISSVNGMVPFPYNGPYNCAKHAVKGFNMTLIQELRGSNVRVMSVHPGGIKTNIARDMRFCKQDGLDLEGAEVAEMFDNIARTTADEAARQIVRGIVKGKERLLVGGDAVLIDLAYRLFPLGMAKFTGMVYAFMQKRKARERQGK